MPEAVADRWTIDYYKSHRYVSDNRPRLSIAVQPTPKKQKTMNENQKWKESGEIFQVAQSILSKCGMTQYKSRLACVQRLISLWQENKEAFVGEFCQSADASISDEPTTVEGQESVTPLFELPDLTTTPDLTDLPNLLEPEPETQEIEETSTPEPDPDTHEIEESDTPEPVPKKRGQTGQRQ